MPLSTSNLKKHIEEMIEDLEKKYTDYYTGQNEAMIIGYKVEELHYVLGLVNNYDDTYSICCKLKIRSKELSDMKEQADDRSSISKISSQLSMLNYVIGLID